MSKRSWGLAFGRIAVALAIFQAGLASATLTFTVNTTADLVDTDVSDGLCMTSAGTCSLRAAVMQANASAAAGPVILLPAGTYALTRPVLGSDGPEEGDLNLTTPSPATTSVTTIVGAGAASTIIDGNRLDRIFNIAPDRTVSISGVALTGGLTNDPAGGGAILNQGELTVSTTRIYDNTASGGPGGGISHALLFGDLWLDHVEIARCVGDEGGGLATFADTIVTDSTFSQNTATGNVKAGRGGGILAVAQLYGFRLTNVTIVGNQARDSGGGLYAEAGEVITLTNTTIALNTAISMQDRSAAGGGIATEFEPVYLYNSIVAGNYDAGSPVSDDCYGVVEAHANNLFGSTPYCDDKGCLPTGIEACSITQIDGHHDVLNEIGLFGNLDYNGGPTRTLPLLPGSNAIDYADPATGCLQEADQRGARRPFGAACDVGSYEFQGADAIFDGSFD